ncbi:DeoR/GlpR family DNA-binding transcription regulator [Alkalihalobacillus sp. MEB130]|uniref:DeoR/GlpR family DNA-binding transcription regulator n=1 Tax=Alkalihalobacillus sp. MEB130 TaxID=2976704 RepID=UPI0028DE50DF|nr:DeoR/GlpR family DNA-binding transcription regulator [Alkalihalobacillus sp. MEB130]MDT8859802.1 DeoR/GlpR family DNA-binding transcription regulator [Alkalihalobacillus sp. MEB130]
MLSVERYEKILGELDKNKAVKVSELSSFLGVTDKTIRLDLETLEKKGLLKRIHGGAVLLEEKEDRIFPIDARQSTNHERKIAIANEAINGIKNDDTILLDGGSTTFQMAKLLGDFPVSVITNDINIAHELIKKEKVQLMMLGGSRIGTSSSLYGGQAIDLLNRIRVHQLFFGATGVSIEHGLTVLNSFHVEWKRKIIECADRVTLLADSTKFEKVGLIQFATLADVDSIITDDKLDVLIQSRLQSEGTQVIISPLKS